VETLSSTRAASSPRRRSASGAEGPEVGAKKTDRCLVAVDGRADLGEVVLLPGSSGGAVEVLAIAVVDGTSDSAAAPSSVEDCLVEYQRLLDPAEKCTVDDACVGCIFASRSLEFVDATRLTLEIELSTACAGVFCEPGSTCVEGECVSSSCPAGANECAVGVGGSGAGAAGGGGDQGGAGQGGAAAGDVWSRFDTFDVDGGRPMGRRRGRPG
jgi:hypothetical protein